MQKAIGVLIFIVGICSVAPARAGDVAPVKCGTNQDRVWVYDSLTSFDVQSKIRCGETVEIIGRAKGYVKVRMHDGSEGYVSDSALPGLPPLEDKDNPAQPGQTSNTVTPTESLGTIARRVAPRPAAASVTVSTSSNTESVTATVAAPAAAAVPVSLSAPAPQSPVLQSSVPQLPAAQSPALQSPAPQSIVQAVPAPPKTPAIPKTVNTAASVPAAHPTHSKDNAPATASAIPAANPVASSNAKPSSSTASHAITAGTKPSTSQPPAANAAPNPPVPNPAPPKSAPVVNTESAANIPAPAPARATPGMRTVSEIEDSEEFPDFQPVVSDSADPACQSYFSAYGLAPSQLKWIAQERKKEFPSICPAPDPSMVDFVVIFTHDVNAYTSTLPTPVHSDRNGFSDFSATVGVDTAALSTSEADKAHHQFVWVFQMKRGAFNPATFSPRRRYQYAQVESNSTGSKAGVKTIEDAFEFAAAQQTPGH